MDIGNWNSFLKISAEGNRCMAQQTYEPLINPEGNVFCANYDWQNLYQRREDPIRPLYTEQAVDYFFKKEVEYILKYEGATFMPKVIDIDFKRKRVYFKWNGETCNEIIYSGRNLADYCPNWKEQIKDIELGLYKTNTYKLTMYPHCHFIDTDGLMKAIDWYGCIPVDNFWVPATWMDSIIHHTAKFRLEETGDVVNGNYNLEAMFKQSLGTHVKWGDDDMQYIYKEIFDA